MKKNKIKYREFHNGICFIIQKKALNEYPKPNFPSSNVYHLLKSEYHIFEKRINE